ncbi:MAG: ribosome silencing factor [Byssovorax sp.]
MATTKKRASGDSGGAASKKAQKPGATGKPAAKPGSKPAAKPAAKRVVKPTTTKPRIRASHAAGSSPGAAPRRRPGPPPPKTTSRGDLAIDGSVSERDITLAAANRAGRAAPLRKTPIAGPKRTGRRSVPPAAPATEQNQKARALALALASAGLDKKAVGIEILDVTGKVDYADFLVIMTGRSDRHVHAIATGIDEAMSKEKVTALSIEGLSAATWVLIDYGDVVVHVFQEDARQLYDIEGLWTEASRVPVPSEAPAGQPS